jgi:hypothetical protein
VRRGLILDFDMPFLREITVGVIDRDLDRIQRGPHEPWDDRNGYEPLESKDSIACLKAFGVWPPNEAQEDDRYSHPMTTLLETMVQPAAPRFSNLLPLVEQWRDALLASDES